VARHVEATALRTEMHVYPYRHALSDAINATTRPHTRFVEQSGAFTTFVGVRA